MVCNLQGCHDKIYSSVAAHEACASCSLADIVRLSSGADMMCRAWDHESGKQLSIYRTPGLGPSRKAPQKGIILETAPAEAETAIEEPHTLMEPSTASTAVPDAAQPQENSVAYCNGADAAASADEQVGKAGCAYSCLLVALLLCQDVEARVLQLHLSCLICKV